MRTTFIAALLAVGAQAIQITGITKGDKIDLSAGYTVTWSTVSSDPSSAHLFLVNMAGGHTPYSKDLGEVDLKKGSVSVKETVDAQTAYQFNLQSVDPLNTGILAQSQQFEVIKGKNSEDTKTSKTSSAASAGSVTSSAGMSDATESAATTFTTATATATGSGAAAANGTKTGTTAPSASTAGAAANKVGVLAALAGLVAAAL